MRKIIFILASIFILQAGLFYSANAQVTKVRIKVNGLACSFCAYGLEKKLKKLHGVGKVHISLNKGLATLDNKPDQSIEFANLKTIVKAAGFSATEIAVTVQGVVRKSDDIYILAITHSKDKLILENNEKLNSLLSMLNGAPGVISAMGILYKSEKAETGSHPFELNITWFETR
ncbi:MAG: heavy-metal-associated domain-containing protein [Calditrichaeota bacterium]|nr:heavy-metal-associated domain-containing protein [Calditrichota bacterium]